MIFGKQKAGKEGVADKLVKNSEHSEALTECSSKSSLADGESSCSIAILPRFKRQPLLRGTSHDEGIQKQSEYSNGSERSLGSSILNGCSFSKEPLSDSFRNTRSFRQNRIRSTSHDTATSERNHSSLRSFRGPSLCAAEENKSRRGRISISKDSSFRRSSRHLCADNADDKRRHEVDRRAQLYKQQSSLRVNGSLSLADLVGDYDSIIESPVKKPGCTVNKSLKSLVDCYENILNSPKKE